MYIYISHMSIYIEIICMYLYIYIHIIYTYYPIHMLYNLVYMCTYIHLYTKHVKSPTIIINAHEGNTNGHLGFA